VALERRKNAHEAIKPVERFIKRILFYGAGEMLLIVTFPLRRGPDASVLPARYPDPFTGPVTGSLLDTDPSTGNPFTPAVIVSRIPGILICWWDPDFFVCPMSMPARRWRRVIIGICAIPGMTARVEDSAPDNCRTNADSHPFPSIMLSASRPCR